MNEPKRYHTIEEIPKLEIEFSDYMAQVHFEERFAFGCGYVS